MAIKKYSRLISLLLFIEYGLYLSLVASILANVRPMDEYAPLVCDIGYGLLFHALMCILVAIVTGILIRKRLKLDTIASSLHAMLAALISLPVNALPALLVVLFDGSFFGQTSSSLLFWIINLGIYFVGLILPYLLIFRRLRKKPSLTSG